MCSVPYNNINNIYLFSRAKSLSASIKAVHNTHSV